MCGACGQEVKGESQMKQLELKIWARGHVNSQYELKEQGQIWSQGFSSGPKH